MTGMEPASQGGGIKVCSGKTAARREGRERVEG